MGTGLACAGERKDLCWISPGRNGGMEQRHLPAFETGRAGKGQKLCAGSVSYTHLDVYKRQQEAHLYLARRKKEDMKVIGEVVNEGRPTAEQTVREWPVSYTHLDVYKRQLPSSRQALNPKGRA